MLYLSDNNLNGSIPPSLGALPSLTDLSIWSNDLDGEVPMELGNISTLTDLDLSENRLSGELPETLGNLTNLESFDAVGNYFSGPIPDVISRWNNIEELKLIGNDFTRPFPKFGFKNLTTLWIADVPLNGLDFLFPDISSMKSLESLILRNCSIRDHIPDYIGTMTYLEYLDLSFNNLIGEVPKSLSKLPLKTIYLTGNKLNGSIPSWGTNSTSINADFSNNNFTNVSLTYRNSTNNTNLFMCCSPTATVLGPWQRSNFSCDKKTENDYLFINCGGYSAKINGSTYEADLLKYGASTYYVSPKENWAYSSTGDFITLDSSTEDYNSPDSDKYIQTESKIDMNDAPLYTTARISPLSLKYYALCLVNGKYTVDLHFAEILFTDVEAYSKKGSRVFHVFIQGKIVLKDFDITREAGGPNRAIVKTFTVSVKDHRPLEIHFYWAGKGSIYIPPGLYGPLISAISITRVPVPVPKGSGLSAIIIAGIAVSAFLLLILALGVLWKMGWLGGKKSTDEGKGRKSLEIIIGTAVSTFVVVSLSVFSFYHLRRRKDKKLANKKNNQEVILLDLGPGTSSEFSNENSQARNQVESQELPLIQLDIIQVATNNFSITNKLGEGGFGPVYKGILHDGKEIAVKRLSKTSGQGLEEFKNEVILISKLQHRNLVRLLACCIEGDEKLLIYEYMPNTSLDAFLFDPTKREKLDWKSRFSIIGGIARGLLYLHEDSRLRIIHRDLKTSNVLLDYDMNPKISDFGLARIFAGNQNQANTKRIVGTYGYMAPEYAMEGLFSVKSDVFSFGVLMLEIISGKRNTGFYLSEHGQSLLAYAWKLWCNGEGLELMDPLILKSCVTNEVLKCIHIGLLCVQEDAADRPNMSSVVVMLGSESVTLPKPNQPAFSVGRAVVNSSQSSENAKLCSINEVTLSSVSPR